MEPVSQYIADVKAHGYTKDKFDSFILNSGGFDKLKKGDLDKIINEFPGDTIGVDDFMDIYKMVSENKYGQVIGIWTWIVGFASVISLFISIASLIVSIVKN